MRYMRYETIRVKPGQAMAWEEARKMVKAADEKANIDENMAIYQVVGGQQAGTYLLFIPWKSLDGLATLPHGKNYQDAMGEDNMKKVDKMYEGSIAFDEISVYVFDPQLSYMSAEMVARDPGFWTFKPMPMPGGQVLAENASRRKASNRKDRFPVAGRNRLRSRVVLTYFSFFPTVSPRSNTLWSLWQKQQQFASSPQA